jgi:hypothetical protein
MRTETVRCANWNSFKSEILQRLFERDPFVRGVFLFRGQRSASWPLKASFDRWFDAFSLPESARVLLANALIDEFEKLGKALYFASLPSRYQTVALAQHYGLPTRLLDWTESPYTAAFFAFAEALEKPAPGESVAIYALDTRSYVWQGRGVTLVHVQGDGNFRLRNQDGRFSLLESQAISLEDHIGGLQAEAPWPLYKFEIPSTDAAQALSELDVMGANAARLYPDLQGLCLSAKLNILLRQVGLQPRLSMRV